MKIVVKPYLFLQEALGKKEIYLDLTEGLNIQGLLQILKTNYALPDKLYTNAGYLTLMDGKELRDMTVLVNGHNIKQLQGTETPLKDGAVVSLFPPVAGG